MRYLPLILLSVSVHAAEYPHGVSDWTSLGYYVLSETDGTYISHHETLEDAYQAASHEAFKRAPVTSRFLINYPQPPAPDPVDVGFDFRRVEVSPPPSPNPPPEPPPDPGTPLDPNTAFACDGGENGTTVEPTGNDSNSGRMDENGNINAVKSLKRLEQVAESMPDGVDYRLCEGGIWNDQTLTIRKSGDVGMYNKALIALATPKVQRIKNYRSIPGWNVSDEDYVIVGCYKILNGVPRPCINSYPLCEPGIANQCVDPDTLSLLPYYQG